MHYLIAYFAVGVLLASALLLHRKFVRNKIFAPFIVTALLWPLMILFAPEFFLRSEQINSDRTSSYSAPPQHDPLSNKLSSLTGSTGSFLTEEEKQRLNKVIKNGEEYISTFGNQSDFQDILFKYWNLNIPPEIYYSYRQAHLHLDELYDPESQLLFSRAAPDWYIGFSHEFVKSIAKTDRKKQGRILEAIGKIAASPTEVCGDTIKPLSGELAGLWRCRLGDDRLIYYPDSESKKVVLISFGPRGDAYTSTIDIPSITNA